MNNPHFCSPRLLRMPSNSTIILAGIGSYLNRIFPLTHKSQLKNIGGYALTEEIHKDSSLDHEYKVGVYRRDGMNYIIKTWNNRFKDYAYFALVKESIVCDLLTLRIGQLQSVEKLRVPTVCHTYITAHSFSVIYEFIEGTSLEKSDEITQRAVIKEVFKGLSEMSELLTEDDKKIIPVQNRLYYAVFLCTYSMLAFWNNFHKFNVIFRSMVQGYRLLLGLDIHTLNLAHRDITPSNILVCSPYYYLLDFESVILTYPSFDEAASLNSPDPSFFQIYISLQRLAIDAREYYQKLYMSVLEGVSL